MKPAVSIVVPVYNPGAFFERCISSLCSQTLKEIEIIFVNDCSSDGSRDIISKYAEADGRIIVIDSDVRLGAGRARNIGIERAQGEMLAFVDSDDFIDEDFLEKLWKKHIETGADIVKGERKRYNPDTGEFSPDSHFCNEMHRKVKEGKGYFVGAFTSAMYNRILVVKNNIRFLEDIIFFEDAYFPISAEFHNSKTETVEGTYYYYTLNSASVCSVITLEKQISDRLQGAAAIMETINKVSISDEQYMRIFEFLFSGFYSICRDRTFSDDGLWEAIKGLKMIINRCRASEELLFRHFEKQKTKDRRLLIDAIRQKRV